MCTISRRGKLCPSQSEQFARFSMQKRFNFSLGKLWYAGAACLSVVDQYMISFCAYLPKYDVSTSLCVTLLRVRAAEFRLARFIQTSSCRVSFLYRLH